MKKLGIILIASLIFMSCKTTHFDTMGAEKETNKNEFTSLEREEKHNEDELEEMYVEELLKEIDIEKTVVYVEKPIYYPADEKLDKPSLTGKDAVNQSTESALQSPNKFVYGTMYYDFDPDFVYEIYCQPYRVTDLQLEPGEQVIEMPFLSEEKVWEIGAGVSRSGGVDTQHFFLKPAYSGLVTSFIIITDKRVYHLLLKSFKDTYMTQVKWKYPNSMPFTIKSDAMIGINKSENSFNLVDPRFLSFDYKMTYSIFKKPYWLPVRIYDDGKKTYIAMNETVLHMTSPVLFNNKNERINYSVDKNLIVINELIEKVTLRVGKEKVTITKKKTKESSIVKEEKKIKKQIETEIQ